MKALSIKNPFALMIVEGVKKIEYRSWKTEYRGKFLIACSQSPAPLSWLDDEEIEYRKKGKQYQGNIIGSVDLIDIQGYEGDYKWILGKNKKFKKPIKYKGQLGLHTIKDEKLLEEIKNQL